METERIALSQRERDRLKVLHGKWKSNGGWTARIGCASAAAMCACGTAATGATRGKSFRPTASSPYREATQKCPSDPSMAYTSIWQKTGHFYFALTAANKNRPVSYIVISKSYGHPIAHVDTSRARL